MLDPLSVLIGTAAAVAGVYFVLGGEKGIAGDGARDLARKYGGKGEEESVFNKKFNAMWDLTWRAKMYEEENHVVMLAEVVANLVVLQTVAAAADASPTGDGPRRDIPAGRDWLRRYRVAPANGSYVVFSDIHLTDKANRQSFFETSKNKSLYLDVLRSYYSPEGFTLVENGDVEELLIHEPELGAMPDFAKDDWAVIFADRDIRKRAQFRRILADHADYYQVIHDHFIARGAYQRTIGNHDHDLATDAYVADIKATLGYDFPAASDMLLLSRHGKVEEIICHGHQFDTVSTAAHARFAGESFSQGGAWAFQGPDRNWTEDKDRVFLKEWREGDRFFTNMLVPSAPGGSICQLFAAAGKFARTLQDADKWEALYGKNIGWEYFKNDTDAAKAFHEEVKEGVRWYKYRHMDEMLIASMLASDGPRLTLGHSHEPRLRPGFPGGPMDEPARVVDRYLNSAAAGRFENLVFGIEIVDGTATLISWSREADDRLRRTEWADGDLTNQRYLMAASHRIFDVAAADAPPAVAPFPIAAITHLLLS